MTETTRDALAGLEVVDAAALTDLRARGVA